MKVYVTFTDDKEVDEIFASEGNAIDYIVESFYGELDKLSHHDKINKAANYIKCYTINDFKK